MRLLEQNIEKSIFFVLIADLSKKTKYIKHKVYNKIVKKWALAVVKRD
jgi:hypothetical protein